MEWIDIASIVFICVTANHLGLISAVEKVIGIRLPIINCPKCLTFWMTFCFCCYNISTYGTILLVLAVSFLSSYAAIWLELFEGFIDTLYLKLYGKIATTNSHDTVASDSDCGDSASTVS